MKDLGVKVCQLSLCIFSWKCILFVRLSLGRDLEMEG